MSRSAGPHGVSVESLLGEAADDYTQRLEHGEHPDIEEYAERYPQIAAVIREVFPALGVMHTPKAAAVRASASFSTDGAALKQLGDYRILREIGRGGMGVVFEAEQISLGRRVALKVLPFAAVLDQRHLRRFQREAQAVAQLHHTNIVPVFSVGCERGVHYYAMQYIEGQPLSAVITELRDRASVTSGGGAGAVDTSTAARGSSVPVCDTGTGPVAPDPPASGPATPPSSDESPRSALTPDGAADTPAYFQAVARLGIQAAEALQHAHEHGVVHRDVKPANLLLDATGHVWVTDFGLARVATDPGLTLPGDVLGTLRYMSPEQALAGRMDVDHRTDIYSLGVTLYELCSLRPAIAGRDRAELLRKIGSEEPPALRRVSRAIPRELAAIVGKAISKEPAQRYREAHELADDLRRFLEHRPILARRPTLVERAAKWSRRHRTGLVAGAVTLNIAVLALSVSTILVLRERSEALKQRDAAEAQRRAAEAYSRAARGAVDRMLPWVPPDELSGAPHMRKVREALLDDPPEAQPPTVLEKTSDVLARIAAGQAYLRVGHINTLLRRDARAEEAYRCAVEVFANLATEFPDTAEHRLALANSHASLATMLWERSRFAEAEPPAGQAVALLDELDALNPNLPENREALAQSANLLGLVLRDLDRFEEAESSLGQAVAIWRTLAQAFPETPRYRRELARSLRNLGGLMLKAEQPEAAGDFVREAVDLQRKLVAEFPAEPAHGAELAHTLRWWKQSQRGGAAPDLDPDPALLARAVAELPPTPWYREKLAASYQNLDKALEGIGQSGEAERAHQQAVNLQVNLVRSFPNVPEYRVALADLHLDHARALAQTWRLTEAEESYSEAVDVLQHLVAEIPEQHDYRRRLASALLELDSWRSRTDLSGLIALGKDSPAGVAQAVERACAADINGPSMPPFTRLVLAEYRMLGGEYEAAAEAIQLALDEGGSSLFLRSCYCKSLGWARLGCGQPDQARRAFEEALHALPRWDLAALQSQCPDPWTAAYFLDVITQAEYTNRWRNSRSGGVHLGCFPWFYVGMRMELEGRIEDARAAYRTCVELGRTQRAHHTANWAAYRLERLPDGDS